MEAERFSNDIKLSSTKMARHGLEEFSLFYDNVLIENYPLKVNKFEESTFYHEFYKRWLIMTENYEDSDEPIMSEETYMNTNFMILETFRDLPTKSGQLKVKLNFEKELDQRHQMTRCSLLREEIVGGQD